MSIYGGKPQPHCRMGFVSEQKGIPGAKNIFLEAKESMYFLNTHMLLVFYCMDLLFCMIYFYLKYINLLL